MRPYATFANFATPDRRIREIRRCYADRWQTVGFLVSDEAIVTTNSRSDLDARFKVALALADQLLTETK